MRIVFLFLFANAISASVLYGQESASIINEEFANRPFGKSLSVKNIKEVMHGSISSKKYPVENKATGGIDTLLIFSSNESEITFYKSSENVFFYRATICGRGLHLAKGVQVGMSKDSFIKALDMNSSFKGDIIIVKNSTEYANHKFHFKNNNLFKIELDAGLD